jgi:hypothetical protein
VSGISTSLPEVKVDPSAQGRRPALASDLLVCAVILLLVWIARQISLLQLFKPGDDTGYWMGVVGAVMMLLVFTYPVRKHFRFAFTWGAVKWWLIIHMVLGVGGPVLILIHAGFAFGSLNAAVALFSMIIVALSGIEGRFIYTRVNRGLHGEISSMHELKTRAGIEQEGARSRLNFAPAVEQMVTEFDRREQVAKPSWRTHVRRAYLLPVVQLVVYLRCIYLLREPLALQAKRRGWDAPTYAERRRLARKLVWQYLNAVVRVAQFTANEWLLSAWHVAHVPFVLLLVGSTLIHIFAVHAY